MLSIGDGWHPTQWVTAAFLHADIMHLVGNMIFLWAYGLVVEGKIGWWRFLMTYLLIAVIQHLIVQTVFSVPAGEWTDARVRYCLGASGAISGLMAIALLWAPVNTFTVVWGYRWGMFASVHDDEITIRTFSLWFIGWDLFVAWLIGFSLCTPMLHLTGVAVGLVAGLLFLEWRWVDCERFDLLTLWTGRKGIPSKQLRAFWQNTRSTVAKSLKQKPTKTKRRTPRPKVVYLEHHDDGAQQPVAKKLRKTRGGP